MENNQEILESCSFASDDYSIRGDLFLVNDWEPVWIDNTEEITLEHKTV
tara:strand:- start:697 stop:843 length:147 start_codon:yes stop_codon:yes gene_type:complete